MIKILNSLLLVFLTTSVQAQNNNLSGDTSSSISSLGNKTCTSKYTRENAKISRYPFMYISTSTGLNNNTGILGFNVEFPLDKHITIDAGLGSGTWNYKFYSGLKYYLKTAQRSFAFGAGLTYATGTNGNLYHVTTIDGYEVNEKFNKNPQTNIFFAIYHYWSLGKHYNRFHLQLGWSTPLSSGEKITQLTGSPVNYESKDRISSLAPGGIIVGTGISFSICRVFKKRNSISSF